LLLLSLLLLPAAMVAVSPHEYNAIDPAQNPKVEHRIQEVPGRN